MKTKTINVYEYNELSKEAKRRALNDWRNKYDNLFLQSELQGECNELIKNYGIECTSNFPICLYSLSYCQGDGLMFYGTFKWKQYVVDIKHSGHYYHSYSKFIELTDESKEDETDASDEDYKAFEAIYQEICKKLEQQGYDMIESENSEEYFIDMCEANEWTFTSDGVMENL